MEQQSGQLGGGPHLSLEAYEHYADHPVDFVQDIIGAEPDEYQRMAFDTIVAGNWPVIFAGHGVGKTALLSWIIIWWLFTRPTCKIPVTSTKKEQLGDNLWPEVKKWLDQSSVASDIEWQKTKVFVQGREETRFAVARTGSSQEALQGFHDDHLLFIVEEASGVADEIFEPVMGSLTNEGGIMVQVGNPTRSSGFFFDAFTKPTQRFKPIHIPCIDEKTGKLHPRVTQEFPDSISSVYGRESNQYRVRVLGLPPRIDDDTVIPWEWVNDAMENDGLLVDTGYRRIWGLDVARHGDDSTCLAKRCGNVLLERPIRWVKKETMQVAGLVLAEWRETPREMRPHEIFVDEIGVGAGVVDRLAELGLPVTGVAVSRVPSIRDKYSRLRDELWWRAREWFETRRVSIPASCADGDGGSPKSLVAELTTLKYKIPSDGKIHVEQKPDYKKRLPRIGSPDYGDCFILTFADTMELIEDHVRDAYGDVDEYDDAGTTWSSA